MNMKWYPTKEFIVLSADTGRMEQPTTFTPLITIWRDGYWLSTSARNAIVSMLQVIYKKITRFNNKNCVNYKYSNAVYV